MCKTKTAVFSSHILTAVRTLRASGKWLLTQPRFGVRMCFAHSFYRGENKD
ncbi:hypothetical protein H8S37_03700 [Mediterraneibacter sp. NSJ-55]|uniref:Uncharacterized protein n=1 Tax=Mediterraneibacter hominis TaxID=2763054 RepID=A0A923LGV0_9FIRM|nr:hypothetical protein [Mediterraneibacter hominis]MBC5688039.1 hypothetical protein [Mediterraneibacter hominis]